MITDKDTNTLYLNRNLLTNPDTKEFGKNFIDILQINGVNPKSIEYPKYYWSRDYLPVQVSNHKYIQFRFDPDYLYPDEKIPVSTIRKLHDDLEICVTESDLIIDGGNVVKGPKTVILTTRIFRDNKNYSEGKIIQKLTKLFDDSKIIIIPSAPGDVTGHADGMVRLIDDSTVFVSDLSDNENYSESFKIKLYGSLGSAGLNIIQVPYFEENRKNKYGDYPATGCYINFLWIGNKVFVPVFNHKMDKVAVKLFEQYFDEVIPVPSTGISEWGGVLNCCSWNAYHTQ